MLELLKTEVQGFENAELEFTGPFIGIRGSRQLKGSYVLTAEDIISCVDFDDTIALRRLSNRYSRSGGK